MAEKLNEQLPIADVYAAALFDLAQQAGKVDAYRAELDELVKLEEVSPDFKAFMSSAAIDNDKRAAGLEKMLRGKLSDDVLNTLLVMNRNGRFGMTTALARCFVLRQEEADNQVEATVTSAVELSKAERRDVVKTITDVSGKTPLVDFAVDAEILGGLVVQVGDLRYDNSVRRQLARARGQLVERGERGLEVKVTE